MVKTQAPRLPGGVTMAEEKTGDQKEGWKLELHFQPECHVQSTTTQTVVGCRQRL